MVAKVMFGVNPESGVENVALIECDRVNFWRDKDTWNVQLLKNDECFAMFSESASESRVCIYLMEHGQTIDRLPQR